jgi:hypothetical protein
VIRKNQCFLYRNILLNLFIRSGGATMKKSLFFLFVFVLIACICFFSPVTKQGFAEGEQKIILKGVIRGGGEPNFLGHARSVDISGNYAYVLSFNDIAMSIFDISDPAKPAFVNSIKVQAFEDREYGAYSIFISGNFAYIYDSGGAVLIYDISDPAGAGPQLKGMVPIYTAKEQSGGQICVEGILAYEVDTVTNGLTILDISDKAKPKILGSITGTVAPNYLDGSVSVAVKNDFVYIASGKSAALTIIDVKNPKKPVLAAVIKGAGEPNYLGGAMSIFLDNDYAYIASSKDAALSIIDVINPLSPVFSGFISGKGKPNYLANVNDVEVVNNYAFVAAHTDAAISVYDVIDAANPVLVDVIKGAGSPNYLDGVTNMEISGNYLYAVSEDDALVVFDISAFTGGDMTGTSDTSAETAGTEGQTGTIDNGEVSILRQWLRIYNPNSI